MYNFIITILISAAATFKAPTSVTVVVLDNNCGNEYITWRKLKTEDMSIQKISVENNILTHLMKNGEIVYVMSPTQSIVWFNTYSSKIKLSTKNKVILFGEKSIDLSYDEDFMDAINEKLGKPKLIIPYEGCNIDILDGIYGC